MLKRLLALGLMLSAACVWGSIQIGTTLDNGLVAHWTMDEINGTTLIDASGHNNDGVITGAIATGGKVGKCLYFDGINDSVVIQPSDSLALLGNFTVNVWVKSASGDYGGRIVSKRGPVSVFDLHVASTTLFTDYYGGQTSISAFNAMDWNMVTIRYRDGFRSYFLNGVREDPNDYAFTSVVSSDPITLGNWGYPFGGWIDDTRIYDRALSDQEVGTLYRRLTVASDVSLIPLSGSKPVYEGLSTNGLVLHYKMDENSWNGTAGEVVDSAGSLSGQTYAGTQTRPSILNRAGYFDGVDDCIEVPNSLLVSYPFSVAFWFKTSQTTAALANKYDNGLVFSYAVVMWENVLMCGVAVNGYNFPLSTIPLAGTYNDGQWHYVVMTAEVGGMVTGYVDGAYKNSGVFGAIEDIAIYAHLLGYISHAKDGPDYYGTHLNGAMDDFRYYTRAITSNEVVQLYNAELKSKKPVAVYQGSKLVYNPDKKNYAKTAPAVPIIPYSPASDFLYSYTPLNKATITGYAGAGPVASIPPEINGREVVTIGDSAFIYSSLTDVEIPASVTTISSEAFRYSNLLTNIVCNARVTTFPNACFAGTAISSFVIPPTLTTLGNYTFHSCLSLKDITIPDGVTDLGAAVFANNTSLTNIVVGSGVTYLYVNSFATTPNLRTMYFRGNAPASSDVLPVTSCIVYRRADATGWPTVPETYAGVPTAIWTTYPNPMP